MARRPSAEKMHAPRRVRLLSTWNDSQIHPLVQRNPVELLHYDLLGRRPRTGRKPDLGVLWHMHSGVLHRIQVLVSNERAKSRKVEAVPVEGLPEVALVMHDLGGRRDAHAVAVVVVLVVVMIVISISISIGNMLTVVKAEALILVCIDSVAELIVVEAVGVEVL